MDLSKFKLFLGSHQNSNVIWIQFPKDAQLIKDLKNFIKVNWSYSQKCWYAIDNHFNREKLNIKIDFIGKEALNNVHQINRQALVNLENELTLKAYSHNTIKTYLIEFAHLLNTLKNNPVDDLTPDRLKAYLLYCINKLKISEGHLQSRINAIKFYFEKVLKRPKFMIDIPRPKQVKTLPKVISQKDIIKMLNVVENIKHLLILKLCYGMGLRVSEIVNLTIQDIDSERMQVLIKSAKGKKDRYVPLPETVLEELRTYYKTYKPKKYLFEGQFGDRYSIRSAQNVFNSAMKKAKINKTVGIHGLRHSYATHLLESGTDISLIKEILGHKDVKTTLIYTHVSQKSINKVQSPLDKLDKKLKND